LTTNFPSVHGIFCRLSQRNNKSYFPIFYWKRSSCGGVGQWASSRSQLTNGFAMPAT